LAVRREKSSADIGVKRTLENFVVILLAMRFFCFLGASRACVDLRDTTAEPRIITKVSFLTANKVNIAVNTAIKLDNGRTIQPMKKLFIVGTGPGDLELLTPKAKQAISASAELVAYGLYIDLLGDLGAAKNRHDLPLGEEINRARLALDLASQGKVTALISSGDIGIYAMATLVFELLDRQLQNLEKCPQWLDVELEVIPGISAMQAGASAVGAMLGHDFCTISLSDLLTPWQPIKTRIECAAAGDFVVSFYNPVSKKRDWQLNTARDILLTARPANTPVMIGRQLTREEQTITIIELQHLDAKDVDMFTMVSVGNSESKHIVNGLKDWVYTPRGYRKKLT
jgi:precorrin-3B C17-methyltransferase